ncbi:hypothetical protein ASH02_18900 [Nocardioides sp. Soil796]|nr:hypothetical protein ASH02_18900 [Nocardioides sp. Soil796]
MVALLKWLTTLRVPLCSWSTRTVATRFARSRDGLQNAAYMPDRRSTSRPDPRASSTVGSRFSRQNPATEPSWGSTASPERRYAGIASPGRTSPKRDDMMPTRDVARRLAAVERLAKSRAS